MDKHHLNIQNQTLYCLNNLWYDKTSLDGRMMACKGPAWNFMLLCIHLKALKKKEIPFLFDGKTENICRKLWTTLMDLCHHCFVWIHVQVVCHVMWCVVVFGWSSSKWQIVSRAWLNEECAPDRINHPLF